MMVPFKMKTMKKILLLTLMIAAFDSYAQQDFEKRLAEARTAFTANKLDDARFAMQQMMQELDILTGKEVLKLLPEKMDTAVADKSKDNVSGASGWVGVVVHREYGQRSLDGSMTTLEILTNSPMIGMYNNILSLPFMGGSNPDQKMIRVGGYKALVQRVSGPDGRDDYEVQLPMSNSLMTLKAPGLPQDKVVALANTVPVADIAKLVQ
jgi:hypothetical protein